MIGWYVHHHGAGHLQRFLAVREHLGNVTAFSSLPAPPGLEDRWVELPLDIPRTGEGPGTSPEVGRGLPPGDPAAGGALHWAPLGCDGLRERMAAIAAWIAEARPDAFVVDVSVEVALLARVLGVPTVVVAQRGVRRDRPHQAAYASASAVVAPWTAVTHLAGDGLPDERVAFAGAISRFDGLGAPPPSGRGDVLALIGAGGHALGSEEVRAAAEATGRTWHVAGALRVEGPTVVDHGPDADVWALLGACDVVVGTAGGNVVAEVAAARRPFVCLPQERPFREQARQGEALRRLGVAEVLDAPCPAAQWPAVLARAEARDVTRWAELHDGRGAQRLARAVAGVAAAPSYDGAFLADLAAVA